MKVYMFAAFEKNGGIGRYAERLRDAMNKKKYWTVFKCDWSFKNKWSTLWSPLFSINFDAYLGYKRDRVNVVHVQFHVGDFGPLFLPLLYKVKFKRSTRNWFDVVLTLHEDEKDLPWLLRVWNQHWFKKADLLIVHTHAHEEYLRSCGFKNKIVVIPMGCEIIDSKIKEDKYTLFMPGFINPWKGYETAIGAVYDFKILKILKQYPVKLVIAGEVRDVGYFNRLKKLVKYLGIDKNVVWKTGFLSDAEYSELMGKAGIVLLPYRRSTMSAVLSEAVGFGKHVIASSLPAFKEYLNLNNYSLYFATGTIADDALLYREIVNTYECWDDLDVKSLRYDYSWKKTAIATIKSYHNI